MSQFKDAAIGDTVYFWFAANDVTGTASDGTTPLFDARLAGDAAGAAPILSGTPTLLTHANYSNGLYEIAVVATVGNGFASGNEYAVFCTLTVSSVNPAGFVGSFKLVASGKTLHDAANTISTTGAGLTAIPWNSNWDAEVESEANDALVAQKLDHLVAVADADEPVDNSIVAKLAAKGATADWSTYVNTTDALEAIRDTAPLGTAMRGTDNAALASVCTETRLAELDAANIPADLSNILTESLSHPTLAEIEATTVLAKQAKLDTLHDTRIPDVISLVNINAEVDTAIVDARLDELLVADSDIDGAAPPIVGSVFHELLTKTAGSFTYDQTTDSLEAIRDTAPMGTAMRGTDNAALASVCTESRLAELDAGNLPTDIAGVQSDTNDIQSRIPLALVSGRMDSSVGAMAAAVVTAAAVATNAIDADALASDAVNEIADGVWDEAIAGHLGVGSTGEKLNAAGGAGDPWTTALPGSYGGGSAGKIVGDNLNATVSSRASQASLDTLDDYVDTEVAAIKAKTDSLTFTVASQVDANIKSINNDQSSAANLGSSTITIVRGTVDTTGHTPTTTVFQADDITEPTADHFNGRIIIFTSGDLKYQATDIVDYVAVGGIGQFTVTAMTEAPANNNTFVIV